jgi:sec-independent protein translocase protein TatA
MIDWSLYSCPTVRVVWWAGRVLQTADYPGKEPTVIGELQPWHLLIVAIVFIVLFGSKKLPDASRSLGRSLRIFKSEVSQLKDDEPRPAQRGTEPIEGRVVDGTTQQQRAATPGESSRDL